MTSPPRRHFATLPADQPIPLALAHNVVERGRSTIYAWVERGLLEPEDTPDGMMVTPAQVREAEAKVTRGRPAKRRATRNVGQNGIESHVD